MENLQVNIRMYKVGELGDCFLLNFKNGDENSTVLIDCGSFRNSNRSIDRLKSIALDIKSIQTTDNKTKAIDLVVGTHQHNDHLSGFVHAKDTFESIGMQNVWLSWLDNPTNEQAILIANGQRKLSNQLQAINTQLSNIKGLNCDEAIEHINDVLGFYSLDKENPFGSPMVPQEGINVLKRLGKNVSYLNPGQILDLPGLSPGAVKVYVLGPPQDNNLLFDINPKKGESYDHQLTAALNTAEGFLSALTNFSDSDKLIDEPFFPFDQKYEKNIEGSDYLKQSYLQDNESWRKIDTDWLDQAERLALYLDSYTNNSSLVLAFELVESQKVLLFVGDAQTGNWLSWKTINWENKNISLEYLLNKTVLYKVGHHGSHNATLPECLEKMTHPELVCMVPVDASDPNITKIKGWKMPAFNLYKKLKDQCNYRILRMDGKYDKDFDFLDPLFLIDKWGKLQANVNYGDDMSISYSIMG